MWKFILIFNSIGKFMKNIMKAKLDADLFSSSFSSNGGGRHLPEGASHTDLRMWGGGAETTHLVVSTKPCSHRASVLTLLDQSRTDLNFDAIADADTWQLKPIPFKRQRESQRCCLLWIDPYTSKVILCIEMYDYIRCKIMFV